MYIDTIFLLVNDNIFIAVVAVIPSLFLLINPEQVIWSLNLYCILLVRLTEPVDKISNGSR